MEVVRILNALEIKQNDFTCWKVGCGNNNKKLNKFVELKTYFFKILDYNVFYWKKTVSPKYRWIIERRARNHYSSSAAFLAETLDIVKSSNVRERAAAKMQIQKERSEQNNIKVL